LNGRSNGAIYTPAHVREDSRIPRLRHRTQLFTRDGRDNDGLHSITNSNCQPSFSLIRKLTTEEWKTKSG
jgi:hypothetical protein